MSEMIKCPFCEKMADKSKQKCPHCGGPLGFEYKPDASQIPTVVKMSAPVGELKPPSASAPERQCPNCGAKAKANDIICLQCGTNLLIKNQANVQIERRQSESNIKIYLGTAMLIILVACAGVAGFILLSNPLDKAKSLAQAGNTLEAVNVVQAHLETQPDDVAGQLLLGKLLWKTQQYDQSAAALEKVMQLEPGNADAGLMAVSALAKNTSSPQFERQVNILEKVVELHPQNAEAWNLLSLTRGALKNYAGQSEALEKAIGAGKTGAEMSLFQGVAQALAGNARPALNHMENAAPSLEKDAVEGLIAYMAGQRERALASLERANQDGSGMQGIVATRLGLLHLADGNVEGAHDLFMKAAQLPNAPGAAAFFDALCLQARGFDEEAVTAFENVMNTQKEYAQEAALQLALLYLRQNNPDEAGNTLKHARQLGDETAKLLTLEGQAHLMNNLPEEARERFQKAMELDPTYPAAHLEYGLMYVAGGSLREGLVELERFLNLAKAEKSLPQVNEIELLVEQLKSSAIPNNAATRLSGVAQ